MAREPIGGYRHLAERLARAGFAVLRFDWHGTGDSSGDDYESNRVATWLSDLNAAIEELKRRSGVERPALVGLRAGAALAAHVAAEREDVSALVLWIPMLTGAAWVNEMAKLHKLYLRIVPHRRPRAGRRGIVGLVCFRRHGR